MEVLPLFAYMDEMKLSVAQIRGVLFWSLWGVVLGCLTSTMNTTYAEEGLQALQTRVVQDLAEGHPLHLAIVVALCDNDSQGIVPVKNRKLCMGDQPKSNLYWGLGGGLDGYLKKAKWKRTLYNTSPKDARLAIRARYEKTLSLGKRLRQVTKKKRVNVVIDAFAFRGEHIRAAMQTFIHHVHYDEPVLRGDGDVHVPHVIGFIGHDYFFDTEDVQSFAQEKQGASKRAKGVFALSCTGDTLIRPYIERDNVQVLLLNKTLAYPGAWTVGGIVEGLVRGDSPKQLHRRASRFFAKGMKRSLKTAMRAFAYGPT